MADPAISKEKIDMYFAELLLILQSDIQSSNKECFEVDKPLFVHALWGLAYFVLCTNKDNILANYIKSKEEKLESITWPTNK